METKLIVLSAEGDYSNNLAFKDLHYLVIDRRVIYWKNTIVQMVKITVVPNSESLKGRI